jgi:beta-phosphoglucomutase-like phosphatase (HAD superfamily)
VPRNDKNGAVLFDLDGVLVDSRESLIQKALGERGSVTLGLPGERLPSPPGAPRYVVTGLAVCNEPAEEMLAAIRRALVDFDVEERPAPMASTKIVVRPREG